MNSQVYGEWCRRQGWRVVETASSHWYSESYGVYQAFPFDRLLSLDQAELDQMFIANRALALRYSAPPQCGLGKPSYHVVYDEPSYGFDNLSSWARKNVRRGLKNCRVEQIPFERFLKEGWSLRRDSLERQGREYEKSPRDWLRKYSAAGDLPGFEVWGALVNEELAAFLVTFRMDETVYMVHQQCKRDYLREHVNNALAFVVTQTAIQDQGIRSVCYGIRSLDAPANVDEFKFRMGYRPKPVQECVVFHPWASPIIHRFVYPLVKLTAHALPANRVLSKAQGLLRAAL